MKIRAFMILAIEVTVLTGCAAISGLLAGGGTSNSTPSVPNPKGVWTYQSGTGSPLPATGMAAISADGTFTAGHIKQSLLGAYTSSVVGGTWVATSSGTTITSYEIDALTAPTLHTMTGSISNDGNTMTITHTVNGLPVSMVYGRRAAPAAGDALVGAWKATSVSPSQYAPIVEAISITADGAFFSGGGYGSPGAYQFIASLGVWKPLGGGAYELTSYDPAVSTSAAPLLVQAMLSANTLTCVYTMNSTQITAVYARLAAPPSDALSGLWRAITNYTAPQPTLPTCLSVRPDGLFVVAQITNNSGTYAGAMGFGTWVPSPGGYAIETYAASPTDMPPVLLSGTVTAGVFTVSGTMGGSPFSIDFTR